MKTAKLKRIQEKGGMLLFATVTATISLIYGCRKSTIVVNSKAPAANHVALRD